MASVRKRGNAYQIRVYVGKTPEGKPDIRGFTWLPESNLTPKKIETLLQRKVIEYEDLAHKQKADELASASITAIPSFQEFVNWYINDYKSEIKQKTRDFYSGLIKKIPDDIKQTKITQITLAQLEQFYSDLKKTGQNAKTGGTLSPKTLFETQRFINRLLSLAKSRGIIDNNPAELAAKIGKKKSDNEVNFYQPDELKCILDAAKTEPFKYQLALNLLATTGMRKGELMGMKWHSINFETGVLHINNSLQYSPGRGIYDETPKTRNSDRYILLDKSVVKMLELQKASYDASRDALGDYWQDLDYVFTQDNGRPMHPDTIRTWLSEFEKRNPSLPHMNLHAFRHTFVSILIAQNYDIATISRTIGHSDITTTMNTYTHLIQEHNIKKRDALGTSVLSTINGQDKPINKS